MIEKILSQHHKEIGNGLKKIHFDDDIHWKLDYGIDVLNHPQDPGLDNKQSTFTEKED